MKDDIEDQDNQLIIFKDKSFDEYIEDLYLKITQSENSSNILFEASSEEINQNYQEDGKPINNSY